MSLHIVGNANDYGGDDSPPEHGRDTQVYQELLTVRQKYFEWFHRNKKDLHGEELHNAEWICTRLDQIEEGLNQPL